MTPTAVPADHRDQHLRGQASTLHRGLEEERPQSTPRLPGSPRRQGRAVAGSVGPLSGVYRPVRHADLPRGLPAFLPQMEGLAAKVTSSIETMMTSVGTPSREGRRPMAFVVSFTFDH